MSRILGNHPDVFAFQELHFFDEILPPVQPSSIPGSKRGAKIFALLCAIQRNGYFVKRTISPYLEEAGKLLVDFPRLNYINIYRTFLEYETVLNGKKIPCEQTPQNIFALGEIFEYMPDSKVIVMIRDPREVLLSQKNKWKRRKLSGGKIPFLESVRSRINYHPVTMSKIWKSAMTAAVAYENHPEVLFVKYEDLIFHAESVIKNVCAHTGITFNPDMLNIPVVGSSNFSDAGGKLGIDKTKTGQWQKGGLSDAEIQICQNVCGDLMSHFGYESTAVISGKINMAWYKLSLPFSLGLATLFNLKRLKNPRKMLKRITG
jgi:hypothetical protein